MANVVRKGVEGIGIATVLPALCQELDSYFTEIAIPETVEIPSIKPEMEELLSVMADAKIVSIRIINTPEGKSQEGQVLTGKKLSIELELKQKVKYIANEPTQSVHAAHFEKKVSSIWVVIPKTVCIDGREVPVETLLMQGKIRVTPYIEDIYGEQLDRRTIFKNITVLINVTFDSCPTCSDCSPCEPCISPLCEATLALKKTGVYANGVISYTVEIKNVGPVNATNVKFSDNLVPLLGNYNNDLSVNGGPAIAGNPFTGEINIGNILACSSVKVTYSFNVDPTQDKYKNQAHVKYNFKVGSTDTRTADSNKVTTNVV